MSRDNSKENRDYSKLINQMSNSIKGVKNFFSIDVMPGNPKQKGIIAYGSIISSIEDITSKKYIDAVDNIMECENGLRFLCSPVFVNNGYSVYYIIFNSLLSYHMYCIFIKDRFSPIDTIPHLVN